MVSRDTSGDSLMAVRTVSVGRDFKGRFVTVANISRLEALVLLREEAGRLEGMCWSLLSVFACACVTSVIYWQ